MSLLSSVFVFKPQQVSPSFVAQKPDQTVVCQPVQNLPEMEPEIKIPWRPNRMSKQVI
jgi:hypothetical protein